MSEPIKDDASWIEAEILSANFNELRLNKRFKVIAEELSQFPSLPINQASSDWAAAKAAYRFFQNDKVDYEKIIKPHILNTAQRSQSHDRIVVVQDSSSIDFSKHRKTSGLGMMHTFSDGSELKGLMLHVALALSEKGLPLGLLSEKIWTREKQSITGHDHAKLSMKEKESYRWIESLREANRLISENTEMIMVCDREADIYEFFEEAIDLNVGLVVRLQHDRVLEGEDVDGLRIYDQLGLEKSCYQTEVEIPSSGKRQARKAKLEVRFSRVTLASRPRGKKIPHTAHRSDLDLWVVDLREVSAPKGEDALSWTLLTTIQVNNKKDALQVMQYYKMRWTIELYFKTLKTGCNIESCRMKDESL